MLTTYIDILTVAVVRLLLAIPAIGSCTIIANCQHQFLQVKLFKGYRQPGIRCSAPGRLHRVVALCATDGAFAALTSEGQAPEE